MSKQGNGAIDALHELLGRIKGDPNVEVEFVDLSGGLRGMNDHPLQAVFDRCIEQVTSGKGEERHGHGRDFYDQKWLEVARTHGIGFLTGQAEKKLKEAQGMDADAWEREMLGAIVYAAMAILYRFVVERDDVDGCCGNCEGCDNAG